uniref:Uncharacterized protein n=1 Tax=Pygocentrus nattereri TaxID=42514 RepID=A0AAR2JB13_PYGNA
MTGVFRAPDAFSGDEDDDNDANRARDALNAASDESPVKQTTRYRLASPQQRCWRDAQWPARICSMLCCLVIFSFIAVLVSFLYIVLKDLRAEKITTEDGAEIRLLGRSNTLIVCIYSLRLLACCVPPCLLLSVSRVLEYAGAVLLGWSAVLQFLLDSYLLRFI